MNLMRHPVVDVISWNKKMNVKTSIVIFLCCLTIFTCTKKEKDSTIICDKFQIMTERCEKEILEIFDNYVKENRENGKSDFDYKLIESRIKNKISQKQGKKQCDRLMLSKSSYDNERFMKMTSCTKSKTCKEFAKCILISAD